MEKYLKYIKDGLNIRKNSDVSYTVFTIPTQHFEIISISELNEEMFEKQIKIQQEKEILEKKLWKTHE